MSDGSEKEVHLTILSDPSQLGEVRSRIEDFAVASGFAEECAGKIVLAVDEALTNIIRHAYKGRNDGKIEMDMSVDTKDLHISLRDYGSEVAVEQIRGRDLDDVRPGGLGVHIMRTCMDSVEFERAEGGGTRLLMKKALPGPGSDEE
jgi:anti-sigma regulatory factor (Ser/Thr protein kinase)